MKTFTSLFCYFALVSLAVAFKNDACGFEPFKGGDHDLNCLMKEQAWSYDANSNQCVEFVYGGCGGNDNRFYSLEDCEGMCKEWNVCAMKPFTGSGDDGGLNCFMSSEAWSFDAAFNQCVEYVYGGCGGNDNRFNSLEKCENMCK